MLWQEHSVSFSMETGRKAKRQAGTKEGHGCECLGTASLGVYHSLVINVLSK